MVRGPLNPFSEVVDERRRWNQDWYSWLSEFSTPIVCTVVELPSAAGVGPGIRAMVTDANSNTFASVVAGGGGFTVPVVSTGTTWIIG